MQLPRGNLEAVRPRALVLPAVAAALDGGDYASAWALCAANRLDLNLLVDYHWPRFLQSAREFVRQVRVGGGGGAPACGGARGGTVAQHGGAPRGTDCFATCLPARPRPRSMRNPTRVQVPADADVADLLAALSEGSTAAPGGLYAAALPRSLAHEPPVTLSAAAPPPAAAAAAGQAGEGGGKVEAVCRAVRQALEAEGGAAR